MTTFIKQQGIPAYLQIEEYVKEHIQSNAIKPGDRLPTERELAAKLKVSRNTVSEAYKNLEKNGVIESLQGRGTFVGKGYRIEQPSRKSQIISSISQSIDTALKLGFTLEQYLSFVTVKVHEYPFASRTIRIIFIEKSEELISLFRETFGRQQQVSIQPVLLEELALLKDSSVIANADLLVTTQQSLLEVKSMLPGKEITGITVTPVLKSLVSVANLDKKKLIGCLCSGPRFFELLLLFLEKAGIFFDHITLYDQRENLTAFMARHDAFIITPGYETIIRNNQKTGEGVTCVLFRFELDTMGIDAILDLIDKTKKSKDGLTLVEGEADL